MLLSDTSGWFTRPLWRPSRRFYCTRTNASQPVYPASWYSDSPLFNTLTPDRTVLRLRSRMFLLHRVMETKKKKKGGRRERKKKRGGRSSWELNCVAMGNPLSIPVLGTSLDKSPLPDKYDLWLDLSSEDISVSGWNVCAIFYIYIYTRLANGSNGMKRALFIDWRSSDDVIATIERSRTCVSKRCFKRRAIQIEWKLQSGGLVFVT